MPYKRYGRKRYGRKRRYPSRKYWFSDAYKTVSKYTNWETVNKALNDIWTLKGLVNSEKYKFDVNDTAAGILNDGAYVAKLTEVPQGDGDSQRTGNSIYVRSLNIKGQCEWGTGGLAQQFIRIIVLLDTQQIGDTAPTLANVLQSVGGSNSFNQHLQIATVGRFKILYNNVYELDNVATPARTFEINKVMRHHVRFNGSAGTDVQKGGLYLMAISSSAANPPTLTYSSRLSYHDN